MQSNTAATKHAGGQLANMKALTWKAVFASMNPSPIFEAVAMFAEALAINGDEFCSGDSAGPKRKANDRSPTREADLSSRRSATWGASRPTRNAHSVRM
jgi:hypothetical protein